MFEEMNPNIYGGDGGIEWQPRAITPPAEHFVTEKAGVVIIPYAGTESEQDASERKIPATGFRADLPA